MGRRGLLTCCPSVQGEASSAPSGTVRLGPERPGTGPLERPPVFALLFSPLGMFFSLSCSWLSSNYIQDLVVTILFIILPCCQTLAPNNLQRSQN